MSTFTKVLIVLLSLSCIFLCGSVVTYVGSTSNAKKTIDQLKADNQILISKNNTDNKLANDKLQEKDLEITKLGTQIATLESDNNQLMIDFKNAERSSIKWQDRVNSWAGTVKSFEQTISDIEKSLLLTREQLAAEQAKNLKISGQLNEVTISLDEHVAMLDALKAEKRRILEQKTALEKQLERILHGGSAPAICEPVTPIKSVAMPASTVDSSVAIKGQITEIGSKLVALSVGSSDGVKEGMKFHVTRGDSFICDLMITNVDVDKCAGVVELKNTLPKIGDVASTEL